MTFSENWVIKPDQIAKLEPDSRETDVYFIIPSGNSRSSYEIGNMFGRPVVLNGLGCRNIDIASFILAKGNEAYLAGEDLELPKLLSLLRARKVFRQTKVLYPTNPSESGCKKATAMLMDFLKTDAGARRWYLAPKTSEVLPLRVDGRRALPAEGQSR